MFTLQKTLSLHFKKNIKTIFQNTTQMRHTTTPPHIRDKISTL